MTPIPERPLSVRFLRFLGPLVLTNVLNALSGTLNIIFLGQLLGAASMAAAVGFFPAFMFLMAFVIGLGTGASVLVGQAHGARAPEKVREVAGAVLLGGVLLGVLVGVAGAVFAQPLMGWLGTPPEIQADSVRYARVMMFGLPVFFTNMLVASVLRGMGDSVTPLRMLMVSFALSAVITPALILGWFGLPQMGVASAGWGTLIGTLAALVWLVWRFHRQSHLLAWTALMPHLRLSRRFLTVARLGVPTALFFITSAAADMGLLALVHGHGVHATAAWGAVSQTTAYVLFPAMSIAIAASVFTAQAVGAGDTARIDQVTHVGLIMNLVLTGSLAVVVAFLAPQIAALFVQDLAVIELAATVLRIAVWGNIIFGMASVFSGVMRATGTVRVPTLMSLGCLVFLLYPLGRIFDSTLGLPFIWLTYPVTFAIALLLQVAYFYGVWKQRPVHRLI
ncbi:MATE family efflux transporter [Hydrogenophaga sp.]|uniref:MATE family efflux transporter n=1 Tax=Hydrogenophaga sp. TaxID=1904254 RepID=UPI00271F4AC0|nr:MATE family efflux transporter [Hydrogenophaga sp.]MDO8903011.1 MATE family efflux transporter [Hydrogenophaga sp.]